MKLLHKRLECIVPGIALLCGLVGCGSYSEVSEKRPKFLPLTDVGGALGTTEAEIMKAEQAALRDPLAALGGYVSAAKSASQFLQTPTVIMGIIVIAAIAYAFDMLMRFIERKVVPWKGKV